jgi:hypothetical protein
MKEQRQSPGPRQALATAIAQSDAERRRAEDIGALPPEDEAILEEIHDRLAKEDEERQH